MVFIVSSRIRPMASALSTGSPSGLLMASIINQFPLVTILITPHIAYIDHALRRVVIFDIDLHHGM